MRDAVVLLITAAFFALCAAYIWWCDRIIGADADNVVELETEDPGTTEAAEVLAVMIASAADNWIGLGLSVVLTVYLVFVLVKPEKF